MPTVPKAKTDQGPLVRVAGKGKTKSMPFVAGQTIFSWVEQAGKVAAPGDKYFIGQEERPGDTVLEKPATITVGTEAKNGAQSEDFT